MNLTHLSDVQLHDNTKVLVRKEQEILHEILQHLLENHARRLYSDHKMPSIHDYAVSLGYTDAQAGRRITAMYVLRELPELEKQLATGELNVTHLCIAKALFTSERKAGRPLNKERKLEVLDAMAGSKTRGAAIIAQSFSPEPPSLKVLLKLEVDPETLKDIERLRGLNARKGETTAELVARLIKEELARKTAEPKKPQKDSQAEARRTVLRKEECENCGSTWAPQVDHRIPKAAGGLDKLSNFRLLCRSCNIRAAIIFYGRNKMDPFVNPNFAAPRDSLH